MKISDEGCIPASHKINLKKQGNLGIEHEILEG